MTNRTSRSDQRAASRLTADARRSLFDSSGRRWFRLGTMLLVIMGVAVWTVRRDPIAISALFFAIAAILKTVPTIMDARTRTLYGDAPPDSGDAADRSDARAEPHPQAARK
jgi:hypothetical protein